MSHVSTPLTVWIVMCECECVSIRAEKSSIESAFSDSLVSHVHTCRKVRLALFSIFNQVVELSCRALARWERRVGDGDVCERS